jgi:hypothetical protein
VRQAQLRAVATPISANRSMKNFRSSVSRMVFTGVPRTRTLYLSRTPASSSASPQLSAVWPPKESRSASTSSLTSIRSTNSGVTAVRWSLSAIPSLVWMVAMFGLMSTVAMPSSLRALIACVPE